MIALPELLAGLAALPTLVARVQALEGEVARLRAKEAQAKKKAKWYKLREVMEILKVSRDTVERHCKKGRLKRNALSRHVLIAAEEVDNFRGAVCF